MQPSSTVQQVSLAPSASGAYRRVTADLLLVCQHGVVQPEHAGVYAELVRHPVLYLPCLNSDPASSGPIMSEEETCDFDVLVQRIFDDGLSTSDAYWPKFDAARCRSFFVHAQDKTIKRWQLPYATAATRSSLEASTATTTATSVPGGNGLPRVSLSSSSLNPLDVSGTGRATPDESDREVLVPVAGSPLGGAAADDLAAVAVSALVDSRVASRCALMFKAFLEYHRLCAMEAVERCGVMASMQTDATARYRQATRRIETEEDQERQELYFSQRLEFVLWYNEERDDLAKCLDAAERRIATLESLALQRTALLSSETLSRETMVRSEEDAATKLWALARESRAFLACVGPRLLADVLLQFKRDWAQLYSEQAALYQDSFRSTAWGVPSLSFDASQRSQRRLSSVVDPDAASKWSRANARGTWTRESRLLDAAFETIELQQKQMRTMQDATPPKSHPTLRSPATNSTLKKRRTTRATTTTTTVSVMDASFLMPTMVVPRGVDEANFLVNDSAEIAYLPSNVTSRTPSAGSLVDASSKGVAETQDAAVEKQIAAGSPERESTTTSSALCCRWSATATSAAVEVSLDGRTVTSAAAATADGIRVAVTTPLLLHPNDPRRLSIALSLHADSGPCNLPPMSLAMLTAQKSRDNVEECVVAAMLVHQRPSDCIDTLTKLDAIPGADGRGSGVPVEQFVQEVRDGLLAPYPSQLGGTLFEHFLVHEVAAEPKPLAFPPSASLESGKMDVTVVRLSKGVHWTVSTPNLTCHHHQEEQDDEGREENVVLNLRAAVLFPDGDGSGTAVLQLAM